MATARLFVSGNPPTKSEAARWIRLGIELTVIDESTNVPISQKDGSVEVTGPQWSGIATLISGLISKIE